MIVTLYDTNKLYKFKLPDELSGSYSFQDDDGNKIVNIEVRNDKWVLYSTKESLVINGKDIIDSLEITSGAIYYVQFNKKVYPVYVTNPNSFSIYQYSDNSNLVIGPNGSIKYAIPLLNNYNVTLSFSNGVISIQNPTKNILYINGVTNTSENSQLVSGTVIDIYGLILIVCKNYLFISNNPRIQVGLPSTFQLVSVKKPDSLLMEEIKTNNLYNDDSYFSKSARLYRKNANKKIEFAVPPKLKEGDEMPAILTIAPMLAMGITSIVSLVILLSDIRTGKTTLSRSLTQLITYVVMLLSTLLIPILTQTISRRIRKRKIRLSRKKYLQYLDKKKAELEEEFNKEQQILKENLLSPRECVEIIRRKNVSFWSKRNDQEDFLDIRIGIGNQPLKAEINFPNEEFSIEEDELRKQAEALIDKYKTIENVPYSFNLYENLVTGVMGKDNDVQGFINNIILQLIASYSYDDLKIAVFTDDKKAYNWEYIKYLPYSFNNTRDVRFFSTNFEDVKNITEFLSIEFNARNSKDKKDDERYKPHYLLIIDGYDNVKRNDFINKLVESNNGDGFSVLIAESKLSKLPSKCSNFIILDGMNSVVLKSTYQEPIKFASEIDNTIDMLSIAKILANIPIELDNISQGLPDMVSFLEMENVGKVEQLNILNRWNQNDSTQSLKAEIGYGSNGDLMYLDLHEKYHGPHGLIAGMTGSGKSEFIITYILSMCINYSPDDVAFILIDYKGGGLTGAFENVTNGIVLPHLAGTITNLDKAEMDRTLVSIESEIERRQEKFREAKDKLGESTLDIYKYQRLYHDGKLDEAIPHLFIICDEFAELKSQQPDFMSNLISVARIGRSLGVHLILATQKPSGVVDDQIWSNTKFRVCLKVQDQSDSNEMLKRPEAASLKQTGRYYLQVGYDEYFAIGQSAWCGAKYYPSDDIKIDEDRSINFINNSGKIVKTVTDDSEIKQEAEGEQITAIIKSIIDVANKVNKHARRLWLNDVKPVILENEIEQKYNIQYSTENIEALIGEYDAPERQLQGPVIYNFLSDGNTIIYGNDTLESENLLNEIIYTSCMHYTPDIINFYIIDYGSESLKIFNRLPHVGGVVLAGENEKYSNLIKMIKTELKERKKLLSDYGGSFERYNKEAQVKLPIKVVIFDNFSAIFEANDNLYDELPELVADSERYGIVYILTATGSNSVNGRASQFFNNSYVFKLKDAYDATYIFGTRTDKIPRDVFGRGLVNNNGVHEFQTISISANKDEEANVINQFIESAKLNSTVVAKRIPTLPDKVDINEVISYIKDLTCVPVGISRAELNVETMNLKENLCSVISSNKLDNTKRYVLSLLYEVRNINGLNVVVFDPTKNLEPNINIINNYITDEFDRYIDSVINYLQKCIESKSNMPGLILIYSLSKLLQKVDPNKFNTLVNIIKQYENYSIIIVDAANKIRDFLYEPWYSGSFNTGNGVWIGKGASDQNIFQLSGMNRDVMGEYKNDMGFLFYDGNATLCKMIDFIEDDGDKNE